MPPLAALALPSLSPELLSFFATHGIVSVEDFLIRDIYQLPGLRAADSDKLRKAVTEVLAFLENGHASWRNGWDLFNNLEHNIRFLPTGYDSLDSLLQGGLREGTVTELVGASSCGKTQLCMQVSAHVAVRFGAMVAYIDTSNSFSSERLEQMLNDLLNSQREVEKTGAFMQALKNIVCYRAFDVYSMLILLQKLNTSIENHSQMAAENTFWPSAPHCRGLCIIRDFTYTRWQHFARTYTDDEHWTDSEEAGC
ncbi:hypothetical protein O6H91_08G044400 [Diphasiastrum complanatum]|uniref:Uncharacterized protein n=1 Tax=Diphasiastrum complanatum TaxID=34168 RepID=A0ACC2CX32_DIPCM|nr:hypothetical protein O6H91_08G044400 [Diphasiastrum complanatum]